MTTTDFRPFEAQFDEPPVAPMEPRDDKRKGGFVRRLPWAFVVIALAVGYGIGNNSGGGGTAKTAPPQTPAVTPEQINQALSGNGLGVSSVNDRGYSKLENGFQHAHGFPLPLTKAEQAQLSHQMNLARETAMKYPTLGDAQRAGLRRQGPFAPGLGTHMITKESYPYIAGAAGLTDAQVQHPLAWIYDGTKPNSPVAGLMYGSLAPKPVGFAGANDTWHTHKNVCQVVRPDGSSDSPLGADRSSTKAECAAVGGTLMPVTPPLLHVWPVPGYESPEGAFSHTSPGIACADGTYHQLADLTKLGTKVTTCLDGAE